MYGPVAPWQEMYARWDNFSTRHAQWSTRVETRIETWQNRVHDRIDERLDAIDGHLHDYFGMYPPPPPQDGPW